MSQHHPGESALFDSFSGLVPVTVLAVLAVTHDQPLAMVRVKVTKDAGAYRKGELLEVPARNAVPRAYLRKGKYSYTILSGYQWTQAPEGKG